MENRTSLLYVKGGSKIIFTLNINILSKSVTVKIPKMTSNVTTGYIFFPFSYEEFPNLTFSRHGSWNTAHVSTIPIKFVMRRFLLI